MILGGTAEANALAKRLADERPATRTILSLAGRTKDPVLAAAETRIGGFGGVAGLAAFMASEGVTRLVDATHPFAVGISRGATAAARLAGTPRLALVRPAWEPMPSDRWIDADCLRGAASALPAKCRAFLALGRQHLAPFARRLDVRFAVRMVDPPADPLPFPAELVFGLPSADWREEAALFERLEITHLVSRNSGGAASYPKIEAARRLGFPVVMIRRMAAPELPTAATVEEVMAWLSASA
ncbi:cobalt-precorrin-6A reductase [Aureimonas leprariae]|uniref:Cobalt-precorrin-6A reductase n=1 Tax=Plantimonas leprariae TaxID=2615207 RepID=A0A7V7TWD3_9HYPH|nr:cobalt-precorrin-6A reductase [Aureimonas leprariae]